VSRRMIETQVLSWNREQMIVVGWCCVLALRDDEAVSGRARRALIVAGVVEAVTRDDRQALDDRPVNFSRQSQFTVY